MLFESFKELSKHFIFCSFARFYLRMHRCIVRALNVLKCDDSIARFIQNLECFNAELSAEVVHWPDNYANELIEIDFSVTIDVKALEKRG